MEKNTSALPNGGLPTAIAQSPHAELVAALVEHLREFAADKLGVPVQKITIDFEIDEAAGAIAQAMKVQALETADLNALLPQVLSPHSGPRPDLSDAA
jgi:hypothetical protein